MIRALDGALEAIGRVAPSAVRGPLHRRRLADVDTRIVVSGTRGKSSTTRRIYDVLGARGYDVGAKITGNQPVFLHDGETHEIERGSRVTLYENERELREHTPSDALVVENQAISDYTTRVVNQQFADPDVLVIANVRQDHRDTLGSDKHHIARSLARAVPAGVHVINGERDPQLREYLDTELGARDVTVTHVSIPDEHERIPGAESVYAINDVLEAIGEPPLSATLLEGYLDEMRVEWTAIPGGFVYNAAEVNDVESTEIVRQALAQKRSGRIQPFVYLRSDRRARTASFLDYLERLAGQDVFDQVHVAGESARVFERKATFPVVRHDVTTESAAEILDELLDREKPVLLMGNTVAEFMRDLENEIDDRTEMILSADEREPERTPTTEDIDADAAATERRHAPLGGTR